MFQAAIIGVNGYASAYLPQLERLEKEGKLRLAAAVIRNPGKRPEITEKLREQGVRIYPGQEELYADFHPDIVLIPTGIEFHEAMTLQALEHDCSVLLEKPAAPSVEAVDRMIAAAQQHPGRFAAVGFQHVYDRSIHHFKKSFAGRLGRPRKIEVRGLWPRTDNYYARNDWAGRLRSPRGGLVLDSPANNAFAHYINIALFLCGESFAESSPAEILAAKLWRARPEIESFDSCQLNLLTATGVNLDIYFSHTSAEIFEPMLRIECEHGLVVWQQNSSWRIVSDSGEILETGEYGNPLPQMFDDIAEKLSNPAQFCCSLEIAREHTKIIEKLHRNYRIIQVPPDQVKRNPATGELIYPI